MRIASLDIGTNSVLMLIAEIENSDIKPLSEEIAIPQLGADLISNENISEESIQRTEKVLTNFRQIIINYKADIIIANGTEVFRRAKNSEEIIARLSHRLDTKINVISPQEEAYLSFLGVIPNNKVWTVVDIGGGSTEIITGNENELFSNISLRIGSLTLKNQFFKSEIPNEYEIQQAEEYIRNVIEPISISNSGNFIGIGGTITTLAMIALDLKEFIPREIDNYIFHYEKNASQTKMLSKIPASHISIKFLIHPKRAEILFPGALIFLLLQEKFSKVDFLISSKGLRYGAIRKFLMRNN